MSSAFIVRTYVVATTKRKWLLFQWSRTVMYYTKQGKNLVEYVSITRHYVTLDSNRSPSWDFMISLPAMSLLL